MCLRIEASIPSSPDPSDSKFSTNRPYWRTPGHPTHPMVQLRSLHTHATSSEDIARPWSGHGADSSCIKLSHYHNIILSCYHNIIFSYYRIKVLTYSSRTAIVVCMWFWCSLKQCSRRLSIEICPRPAHSMTLVLIRLSVQ